MTITIMSPIGTFSVKRDEDGKYAEDSGVSGVLGENPIELYGKGNHGPLRLRLRDILNASHVEGEFDTDLPIKAQRGDLVTSLKDGDKTVMILVTSLPDEAVPRGYLNNLETINKMFKEQKLPTNIYLKKGYSIEAMHNDLSEHIVQEQ